MKNNPYRPSQPCVTRPSPLGESVIDSASYMDHEGGGKEKHFFYSIHLSIFAYRKQSKTEAGKVLGMKRPSMSLEYKTNID